MNKPDWKDAPEWANWLAMDSDGIWWWYENEPKWFYRQEDIRWIRVLHDENTREQRPQND